jgi:large subunit ribosomal protein L23
MKNITNKLVEILPLIKYPLFTEKTYKLYAQGKYTFIVGRFLKKKDLKFFFENIFNVKIKQLNTLHLPLKTRKVGKFSGTKANYKKIILTLKPGYKLDNVFDNK